MSIGGPYKITAVILAAGYGTRLQKDVCVDESGRYAHLRGVAKPLFPVAGKPLIDHWIAQLKQLQRCQCERVVVVVNAAHRSQFEKWRQRHELSSLSIELAVDEGSTNNDNRSGAIACMQLGASKAPQCDILFIGGDTLFDGSFSLEEFLATAERRIRQYPSCLHVTSVPCAEHMVHKHGIVEVDASSQRVINFKEKPNANETPSRLQCPCFYLMSAGSVPLIHSYLGSHESLAERDAAGHLMPFVLEHSTVFAYRAERRYDIGSLQTYIDCCRDFQQL